MIHRVILSGLLVTMPLGASLASPTATTGLDYPTAWLCDQSKFNWYCDVDPEQQSNRPKTREEEAVERLEAWQKDLKAKRALSILEPTPENVKAYIEAQEQLTQTASLYSDVWRRVVWQNPNLNYELKRPANNAAIAT
ncbi:MAG: conjugal transfer protein TraF, partial [Pseudomonadota bacterium]